MLSTPVKQNTNRILTWRSVLFGLTGIYLMSGLAAYHDDILGGTLMIGNHIPGGAFTYIIVMGLFWNGFWALFKKITGRGGRMMLNSRELAVVFALTLAACYAPTSGLFRYFHRAIMLPWYFLKNKPTWIEYGVLTEYMNPLLFPKPWPGAVGAEFTAEYDLIYHGFFTGLATGSRTLSLADLWNVGIFKAWVGPIITWGPFVFLFAIAVVSIQFLVHRQWSKHEQLSYPVAQVASGFCAIGNGDGKSASGRGVPDIFKNSLFWWGFCPVMAVLLVITLSAWYPETVPGIREMGPNFKSWWIPIDRHMPVIRQAPDWWSIGYQQIYFTIIGLAYFVSAEISLTMGLTMITQVVFGVMFYYAVGRPIDGGWMSMSRAGAYIGYTMILVWTGRNYYKSVFGKAFRLRTPRDDDEALSVTAARVLVVSFVALVVVIAWLCDSWLMAFFYALLSLMMFLGISRIVCETGVPFIHTNWDAGGFLTRMFGHAAIGPRALPFLLHSSGAILSHDPRESLMPYIATGAKVAEDNGVRLRRLYWVVLGAVLLSVVIAFVATTYAYYNYNPMSNDHAVWASYVYLDQAATGFAQMKIAGIFEQSLAANSITRLALAETDPWNLRFFLGGMFGVLALSSLRFRFSKFPIHPVIFLMAGVWSCICLWSSFFIGWFIKTLIVRFGGGGVYQRLKPLFIGMIAAELFMVGALVFIDFAYYLIFKTRPPVTISIMPV
ncbi:MAG: hypothetical protein FWG05_04800 [Kiritimatiellaeota bacterium]|nr:hypothetical protein [Kiritimatiellota bacterium]